MSCFISLMDQLDNMENNQVLIIAATNRLHVIDEALRRPGRFDKELEIGIPDLKERGNILRNMLNNIPHQLSQQQLETIIATTHGYVAADCNVNFYS